MSEILSSQPVEKRYSMLEHPDIGEVWPDNFDAVTICQKETRYFKAKEAHRFIDYFFHYDTVPRHDRINGVILHRQDNEHDAAIMFDMSKPYKRAKFVAAQVMGGREFGYRIYNDLDVVEHDKGYLIQENDFLTYFTVPVDFEPVQGEILGMMISELRDEVITRGMVTLPEAINRCSLSDTS